MCDQTPQYLPPKSPSLLTPRELVQHAQVIAENQPVVDNPGQPEAARAEARQKVRASQRALDADARVRPANTATTARMVAQVQALQERVAANDRQLTALRQQAHAAGLVTMVQPPTPRREFLTPDHRVVTF